MNHGKYGLQQDVLDLYSALNVYCNLKYILQRLNTCMFITAINNKTCHVLMYVYAS